jgi:hypothetical protein
VRLRDDYEAGKPPDTGTVADYLTRWLETSRHDVRPSTWRQRDQTMRTHVIPRLGRVKLAKLSPTDVEGMTSGIIAIRQVTNRRRAVSRHPATCPCGRAARWARASQRCRARPSSAQGLRPELVYLDTAQLRVLLDPIVDHPMGPLVTVAATTGPPQG